MMVDQIFNTETQRAQSKALNCVFCILPSALSRFANLVCSGLVKMILAARRGSVQVYPKRDNYREAVTE